MANNNFFTINLGEARRYWGWFVALGVLQVILGLAALSMPVAGSIVSVMIFGVLLAVAGVAEVVTAFGTHTWGGMILHLIAGAIDLILGVLLFSGPVEGSLALTLVLGIFLLIAGAARIVFATQLRYPAWVWAVLSGIVTLLLGGMVWASWPYSGLWFIGIVVGIELLFRGFVWLLVGMTLSGYPAGQRTPGAWPTA